MAKSDPVGTIFAAGIIGIVGWFLWTRYGATSSHVVTGTGPQDEPPGRLGDLSAVLGDIFKVTPVIDPSQLPAPQPFPKPSGDPNAICVPLFGCN